MNEKWAGRTRLENSNGQEMEEQQWKEDIQMNECVNTW